MGNAAGQPAHAFHLLRLHQLGLQALLRGDLGGDACLAKHPPLGIPHREGVIAYPLHAAVGHQQPVLRVGALAHHVVVLRTRSTSPGCTRCRYESLSALRLSQLCSHTRSYAGLM